MTTLQSRIARPLVAVAAVVGLSLGAGGCTREDIARLAIRQHFGSRYSSAVKIATCESRLQATALSPGGGNIGLFQINRVHATWIQRDLGYSWSSLTNPFRNARVARILYNQSGWRPWVYCAGKYGLL